MKTLYRIGQIVPSFQRLRWKPKFLRMLQARQLIRPERFAFQLQPGLRMNTVSKEELKSMDGEGPIAVGTGTQRRPMSTVLGYALPGGHHVDGPWDTIEPQRSILRAATLRGTTRCVGGHSRRTPAVLPLYRPNFSAILMLRRSGNP